MTYLVLVEQQLYLQCGLNLTRPYILNVPVFQWLGIKSCHSLIQSKINTRKDLISQNLTLWLKAGKAFNVFMDMKIYNSIPSASKDAHQALRRPLGLRMWK